MSGIMFTQPDAAEKVLQESDGAMHYKAIVDEAVRQGLIARTEKNAKWLYTNVRRAISFDVRFTNLTSGNFDLAARHAHSNNQKASTLMANSVIPEDVARNLEAMLSALDKASGVLEIPMEKVRDVFGHRRNSSQIAQEIEGVLRQQGVGHFPTRLNVKQHVFVFLYRIDSVAGRLVKAANQGAGEENRYLQAINRIGEIVQSLGSDEQP